MTAAGRHSKLTDEVEEKLVAGFRKVKTVEAACADAGIDPRTYYYWMKKGRDQGEKYPRHLQFFQNIKRAHGTGESNVTSKLWDQIQNGNMSAIFFALERRYGWKSGGDPTPIEPPIEQTEAIDPTAPDAAEQLSRRLAEKLPADVLARAVEISQGEAG